MVRVRDSSRAHRQHHHVARDRRHRPHPRAWARCTCWPWSPTSLGGPTRARPGGRDARARRCWRSCSAVLAYVFFRPGTARRLLAASRTGARCDWVAAGASRRCRPPCTCTAAQMAAVWTAFAASVALQALVVVLLLRRGALAAHPAAALRLLPDRAPVQPGADGARLLQRLGHPRERLHPLLRAAGAAARQRARLQPGGRGPHRPAVALGRVVWTSRNALAPAGRRRPNDGRPVLHVCDKFGVAGSSIHGVSRLFSWWFPRFDRARFDVVPRRAEAPGAGLATARRARASPVHHLNRGTLRPAHPHRPRRAGARAARAHPARARLRRRRLRAPGRAARWARRSSCTSTSPIRACPPTRAAPIACSRACTDRAIAVCGLHAGLPGARAARAGRARAPHLERRAARRVRAARPRARARRCAPAWGLARGRARRSGTIGRLSRAEGPARPAGRPPPRSPRRAPDARFVLVGDGDLRGRAATRRRRRSASPTGSSSPATARTCPRCWRRSTSSASPRPTKARRSRCSRPWPRGKRHRVHGGRRLPRGARGRAHRAARPAARSGRAGGRALARPGRARRLRAPAGRRRPPSPPAATTSRSACGRSRALYDEVLAARARSGRVKPALAGAPGRRRLGGAARPAARPLPAVRDRRRAAAQPRARVRLPLGGAGELRAPARLPGRERVRHALRPRSTTSSCWAARPAPERAVVLTFDDGRGSLWSVGAPLLERRGMRGIVFLVPGRTRLAAGATACPPGPTCAKDAAIAAEVADRERRGAAPLLGGDRGRCPRGASSTSRATRTPTRASTRAPQVVGFVTPALRRGYDAFDLPLVAGDDGRDLPAAEVPLGRPILSWAAAHVRCAALPRGARRSAAPRRRGRRRRRRSVLRAARAGSSELRALVGGDRARAIARPPRSATAPSSTSWPSRAAPSRSARAARSSTSASPGTSRARRRAAWRARPGTARPSAARCRGRR